MKTFYNNFISILLILSVAFFSHRAHGIMVLQLPGVSYGNDKATTVEIEFLDYKDSLVYTIKGEVLHKSLPEQKESLFLPDKLTGSIKFIKKIRIKAGEPGMLLRLFDNPMDSVPKLILQMKKGFLMDNNKPLEIDAVDSKEFDSDKYSLHSWYKRDITEMARQRGFHIAKIELNVERTVEPPLQPVFKFGVISAPQNNMLMPEDLAGVKGVSLIPSSNAVYMAPPSSSSPNVYFNVAQPPPQMIAVAPTPNQQFPNAPAFINAI